MGEAFEQLKLAIADQRAKVGVIGLGYVGLPLIRAFISAGFRTIGFDVDPKKVDALQRGESYIGHIESSWLAKKIAEGSFEPTLDMTRLREADAILICVPTPLTESRDPDLSYVVSTAETIAQHLRPGQLVVLESTTYPGTTRDVMAPVLAKSNLAVGEEFFLAYSPEREDPGNQTFTAQSIPKVVGAMDDASCELAAELYRHAVVEVVPVSSCEVAEACKILENTYRAVNIAMVNELKVLFQRMGLDIWEVIEAAKTKPFGFQAFYPGPGLGGHCIPIDPFYLSWLARKQGTATRFIELAGEVNTSKPEYVIQRTASVLNDVSKPIRGSRIGILGVAYKPNVDDPRESPSFRLMELLQEAGAELSYVDPHIPSLPSMRHFRVPDLKTEQLTREYLASQDCVIIATDHDAFDYSLIVEAAPLVVDTRNATATVIGEKRNVFKA